MSRSFLIVPDTRLNHGTGHIRRAGRLQDELMELGRDAAICVDYPWSGELRPLEDVRALVTDGGARNLVSYTECARRFDFVVIDAQEAEINSVRELGGIGTTVGIDLGGAGRRYVSYLLDTLPNLETHEPNAFRPDLLTLPARGRFAPPKNPLRILVTPGGDAPVRLVDPLVAALDRCTIVPPGSVDIVVPPVSQAANLKDLRCVGSVISTGQLAGILHEYDVVICTFGLTSYEAAAAGCTVAHVCPTAYHRALSKKVGVPILDRINVRTVTRLLTNVESIWKTQEPRRPVAGGSPARFLDGFDPSGCVGEPSNGPPRTPVTHRLVQRSFRIEKGTGLTYLERFHPSGVVYDSRYFDRAYEQQYGKTYLEDFEHIREMGRSRVQEIRRSGVVSGRLLDIGCAYGPFLSAAREAGFDCYGVDIFEGAVDYVREELSIPAETGSATDPGFISKLGLEGGVDVVTLWYVIEHIDDLSALFGTIHSVLRPGGLLAFSTPSGSGISARRNPTAFLSASPDDHRTIWTPRTARTALAAHGFRTVRTRVTGHHPERLSPIAERSAAASRFFGVASRMLRLGDTFETYAIRNAEGRTL